MKIIEKLIAHYEMAIKDVSKSWYWERKLKSLNVGFGVCWCALKQFETEIYGEDWVVKYGVNRDEYPIKAETKQEAIELLKFRLNILKKELYGEPQKVYSPC